MGIVASALELEILRSNPASVLWQDENRFGPGSADGHTMNVFDVTGLHSLK